jgi:hypothetical protein
MASHGVQVYVRIRPLNEREQSNSNVHKQSPLTLHEEQGSVTLGSKEEVSTIVNAHPL